MELKNLRGPDTRDLAYILAMYLATRVILIATGIVVHIVYLQQPLRTVADFTSIWNVWDGPWYVSIARDGYSVLPVNSVDMANYAFFPLYPLLIRLAAPLIGDYALAGILISNLCLLVACYYLYRYVALDSDRDAARRSARYLLLFPMAFLFSAVLSEALFVALCIACLYYARKGNWPIAGALGFLVPLTRLPGLAIVVPLAYEYLRQRMPWPVRLQDIRRLAQPEAMMLLTPFLGLGIWMAFNYHLTGDMFGFLHIQSRWGGYFVMPPIELIVRLIPTNGYVFAGAVLTIIALAIMVLFYKKVDFGSWMLGILLICIPLFSAQSGYSMLRYLAVVFPLCVVAAKVATDKKVDIALSTALFVSQVLLMAIWTTWNPLIV